MNYDLCPLAFSSGTFLTSFGSTRFDDELAASMVEPDPVGTVLPSSFLKNNIFGTKTKQSVNVVQNIVRNDVRANWTVGWSKTIPRIGITRIQGIMTL